MMSESSLQPSRGHMSAASRSACSTISFVVMRSRPVPGKPSAELLAMSRMPASDFVSSSEEEETTTGLKSRSDLSIALRMLSRMSSLRSTCVNTRFKKVIQTYNNTSKIHGLPPCPCRKMTELAAASAMLLHVEAPDTWQRTLEPKAVYEAANK